MIRHLTRLFDRHLLMALYLAAGAVAFTLSVILEAR